MPEVVSLYGCSKVAEVGEPDGRLIERLRDLLQRAEAGDIQALAYVNLHRDGTVDHGYSGGLVNYAVVGAAYAQANYLSETMTSD